ncbi:hypothetical protein H7H82_17520 [Mycobacterium heidelbergense]|uniref:hypothetical protein n=1 Tax=Mycobacterium heidelbergense TaxID=53376 RepID=UPI001154F445|nr:hypothetical protein [Mycobacterium heidelbergense]MCV7052367.1 hypothetical protein [Mycobacterium heidelbergense]
MDDFNRPLALLWTIADGLGFLVLSAMPPQRPGECRSLPADELDIPKKNLSPQNFRQTFADHFKNTQHSNLHELEYLLVETDPSYISNIDSPLR